VLFLRVNLIVGEAGIFQAFAILFFSTSTTFFTVLSMNAIATNGKIRTGGVYYLISRSLGPATGGSIGILYYLASTVSSAM
jgi:amino acid transporter